MAHDVFISYSVNDYDTNAAELICATLENKHIPCWIGPRNVPIGSNYADCITQAIGQSKAMLLVFSERSDASKHVAREVDAASHLRIPLLAIRIADVAPANRAKYPPGQTQWLDAFDEPLEHYLDQILAKTRESLSLQGIRLILRPLWMRWRGAALIAAAVLAVALLAARTMAYNPPSAGRVPPMSGRWQLEGSDCVLAVGSGNGSMAPYHTSGCTGRLEGAAGMILFTPEMGRAMALHKGDDGTFQFMAGPNDWRKNLYKPNHSPFTPQGSYRKTAGLLGLGPKSLLLDAEGLPRGPWRQIAKDDPEDDPKPDEPRNMSPALAR